MNFNGAYGKNVYSTDSKKMTKCKVIYILCHDHTEHDNDLKEIYVVYEIDK